MLSRRVFAVYIFPNAKKKSVHSLPLITHTITITNLRDSLLLPLRGSKIHVTPQHTNTFALDPAVSSASDRLSATEDDPSASHPSRSPRLVPLRLSRGGPTPGSHLAALPGPGAVMIVF